MGVLRQLAVLLTVVVVITTITTRSEGALPKSVLKKVWVVNQEGPFLGLVVVPNSFEMSPLLQSSNFVQTNRLPCLDYGGKDVISPSNDRASLLCMISLSLSLWIPYYDVIIGLGAPNLNYNGVGRRFRFGMVGKQKVIIVMTGLSMLNAGISTQLLLTLFDVKGVVHFGSAGNAIPELQIGDVTIPNYWAHTGLWNWQVHGISTE